MNVNNMNETVQIDELNKPQKMNIFKQIGALFTSPKKLFTYIANKPNIAFPVILIGIISVLIPLINFEKLKGTIMDTLHFTYKAMGLEYSLEQLETIANAFAIGTVVSTPFVIIATWLITTLILYLVYALAGREKGLKKYFSMVAYISLITVLGQLLHAFFIYFTNGDMTAAQVTSLASLLNQEVVGVFIYSIASSIDVFNIWTYVLYGIGFVYTGGANKKKAYIISVVLFVVVTLITAVLANFTAQTTGIYSGF